MSNKTVKKGYESLMAAYRKSVEDNNGWSEEECKSSLDWVLNRAEQYAKHCHVTRDDILAVWEEDRSYCWRNYYQESNQPDLEKGNHHVMTLNEWEEEGKCRFGDDQLDWKFKCPACGHIQSMREFKEAGLEPHLAYLHCASRHGLGGREDCKWTIGGLLRVGGQYVIDGKYCPRLVFEFADN